MNYDANSRAVPSNYVTISPTFVWQSKERAFAAHQNALLLLNRYLEGTSRSLNNYERQRVQYSPFQQHQYRASVPTMQTRPRFSEDVKTRAFATKNDFSQFESFKEQMQTNTNHNQFTALEAGY